MVDVRRHSSINQGGRAIPSARSKGVLLGIDTEIASAVVSVSTLFWLVLRFLLFRAGILLENVYFVVVVLVNYVILLVGC